MGRVVNGLDGLEGLARAKAAPLGAWARLVGAAAFLSAVTYGGMVDNYFRMDDLWWLRLASEHNADLGFAVQQRDANFLFRPGQFAIFFLSFKLFGLNPAGYYLANLIIHILVSVLVYATAYAIGRDRVVALAAALFFTVAEAHQEAVTWIGAFENEIAVLFLLCFLSWVLFLEGRRAYLYFLSLVSFTLALLTNEAPVTLILLLPLYELLLARRKGALRAGQAWKYAPYLGVLLVYLGAQFLNYYSLSHVVQSGGYRPGGHVYGNYVHYLTSLVVPEVGPSILAYGYGSLVYGAVAAVRGLLAVAVPAVVAWALWRGSNAVRFWLMWIIITLSPYVLFVPELWLHPSRWTYTPSVGFAVLAGMLAGGAWGGLRGRRELWRAAGVGAGLAVLLANIGMVQVREWDLDRRTGLTRDAVGQLRSLYPQLPENATIYIAGLPQENEYDVATAIPLYYATKVRAQSIPREEAAAKEVVPGRTLVFFYEQGQLRERKGE